jgi:hypothetical protein
LRTLDSKGQALAYDFMLALMVFLILFAFTFAKYNSNLADAVEEEGKKEFRFRAESTITSLAESRGIPENWHLLADEEIEKPGLAGRPLVISERRLQRFMEMDYNTVKGAFGIDDYEFFFTLGDLNKGLLHEGTEEALALTRNVSYSRNITEMGLTLWRRQE